MDIASRFSSVTPYRLNRFFCKQGRDDVRSRSFVFVSRKFSKAGDGYGSTTFPSEINVRIVEFSVIDANQKIDKSIVCGLGKATLGQLRPFILMFGRIHDSVSVSPTDGNGPTQGQRKTLTRVGFEPTTFEFDHRCSTD